MIREFKDTPFEQNEQEVFIDGEFFKVYPDIWPACEGHLLFVPKINTLDCITKTLGEAIAYGDSLVESGEIDGYQFGMNIGESAGQTVMWPHVHFMPRHHGDVEGFPGSIRLAHKGHRGSDYYGNHPTYQSEYRRHHKHLWNDEDKS
jgi:diadenosine tetraphosphate (Ap4A) HIT family hydrolase